MLFKITCGVEASHALAALFIFFPLCIMRHHVHLQDIQSPSCIFTVLTFKRFDFDMFFLVAIQGLYPTCRKFTHVALVGFSLVIGQRHCQLWDLSDLESLPGSEGILCLNLFQNTVHV